LPTVLFLLTFLSFLAALFSPATLSSSVVSSSLTDSSPTTKPYSSLNSQQFPSKVFNRYVCEDYDQYTYICYELKNNLCLNYKINITNYNYEYRKIKIETLLSQYKNLKTTPQISPQTLPQPKTTLSQPKTLSQIPPQPQSKTPPITSMQLKKSPSIKKPVTPNNNTPKIPKPQNSPIDVYYNKRVQKKLKELEQIKIFLLKYEKNVLQTKNKCNKVEKQL
jgi:hypothetical protein